MELKSKKIYAVLLVVFVIGVLSVPAAAANDPQMQLLIEKIDGLAQKVNKLEKDNAVMAKEIQQLTRQKTQSFTIQSKYEKQINDLRADIDQIETSGQGSYPSVFDKLHIGGYADIHANFGESPDGDILDFHRLVLALGYDFNDWIKFRSEFELEHAFVADDSGGEFLIEQAYVDFMLSEKFNIRAGKILTPMGIINQTHEPDTFNGVERPSFAKHIIPSTWSSDGIGIFGSINPSLDYQAYVVGGLDGSGFSSSGIRDGRIKERTSLNDVAFTGRLDYYPFAQVSGRNNESLRFGLSAYAGGLDNGNNGDDPGIDSTIEMYSADFEYSKNKWDFRGAVAHTFLDNVDSLPAGTAEEMFGWYLEGAYHFMPEEWKKGKLAESDAVAFLRFDVFDTQHKMPSGVAADSSKDRTEWTTGVNFYLTPNFVVKADYQMRDKGDDNNQFNLGLGWSF